MFFFDLGLLSLYAIGIWGIANKKLTFVEYAATIEVVDSTVSVLK